MEKKILIVDDSPFSRVQISNTLTAAGYAVVTAEDGLTGLVRVTTEKPDLVLLDVEMPGVSGFEICRQLRQQESYDLMPIIMLTGKEALDDKLAGLELGADDYVTKPYNERELLSRIRNTLRRIERNRTANPLTGLPGNLDIQREITSRIARKLDFAVTYADIDHFKTYNDSYGFMRGDAVIKLCADVLSSQVQLFGNADDYVGHVGGDDFIVVTTMEKAPEVCRNIIEVFDKRIRRMFDADDLENGYILNVNRRGEAEQVPLTALSLAVVPCPAGRFTHSLEIASVATELKRLAKQDVNSCFVVDRRTGPYSPGKDQPEAEDGEPPAPKP